MVTSRQGLPSWISAAAATRVDSEGNVENMIKDGHGDSTSQPQSQKSSKAVTDVDLSFGERAFSAAGAAFLSAIIVNPLDVAKTRLQAQAAGVPYQTCFETNMFFPELKSSQSCARSVLGSEPVCPPECSRYKGTLDVFYKVIRQMHYTLFKFVLLQTFAYQWTNYLLLEVHRSEFVQEGFARLWRGTNASLALAVPTFLVHGLCSFVVNQVGIYMPCYDIFRNSIEEFTTNNAPTLTPYVPLVAGIVARSFACVTCYPVELARTRMQAFKETQSGVKPPGVWKTLVGVINPVMSTNYIQNLQSYRILWTGLSAQLARDVPFSAICWSTLEPIRRKLLVLMGDEAGVGSILGANFTAGFVAGSIAAAVTCPLDVAKTRSQIEKDPTKALKMTTRQTLLEIWRGINAVERIPADLLWGHLKGHVLASDERLDYRRVYSLAVVSVSQANPLAHVSQTVICNRDGGMKGLFTGLGPRVGRAGPSVGIVVSFYEVVNRLTRRCKEKKNNTRVWSSNQKSIMLLKKTLKRQHFDNTSGTWKRQAASLQFFSHNGSPIHCCKLQHKFYKNRTPFKKKQAHKEINRKKQSIPRDRGSKLRNQGVG
ncbi:hypothetical protein SCA6_015068 [Theobroma cacao]